MNVLDTNTGEVVNVVIPEKDIKYKDRSRYVKLYDVSVLTLLSHKALRVLFYLFDACGYGEVVYINMREAMAFTGYKGTACIYDGLKELEDMEIIKKKTLREYYVNPNVFYRGRREKYGKVSSKSKD
jgi:hypothetical protein